MTHGTRHLRFNCTACGQCCRDFRVPLTDSDVKRLAPALHSGETVTNCIEWLSPAQVDMTGEPETFVHLPEGRRLMVLRHRDSACRLLDGQLCSVYSARPRSCQLYPWDITLGRRGGVKRLQLIHDYARCEATFDGSASPLRLAELKRWERAELCRYVRVVSSWNRAQAHRQRLGKPLLEAAAFVQRLIEPSRGVTVSEKTRTSVV